PAEGSDCRIVRVVNSEGGSSAILHSCATLALASALTLRLASSLTRSVSSSGSIAFRQSTQRSELGRCLSGRKSRALCSDRPARIVCFAERGSSAASRRVGARFDVGASFEQQLQSGRVCFVGCPHQRSG